MAGFLLILSTIVAVAAAALAYNMESLLPTMFDPFYNKPDPQNTMKAVVYYQHGDTSVLQLESAYARPLLLKPHQVMIQTAACAINPVDFKFRRNKVSRFLVPLPKIPGGDVSGRIVEIGDKVQDFRIGDRVAAMVPLSMTPWGTCAEYVAVDARLVARVGETTDLVQAAALPLVALTVVQGLGNAIQEDARGKKILVHAGAGGVGSFAIQYAKHVLGMYVATTASAGKADFLKSIGADEVIDYHTQAFEDIIRDFDVAYDPMSWLYEERTLKTQVLKPDGHYICVLSSDWEFDGVERANKSTLNQIKHKLVNLVAPGRIPRYTLAIVAPNGKQLQTVMDHVEQGTIRPIIDRIVPFSETVSAFEYLEKGHATGKVVISFGQEEYKND